MGKCAARRWMAVAVAVGTCAVGGCGSAGSRELVAQVTRAGRTCPGGAVTSAGARTLAGVRGSRTPGCPYAAVAAIGRPGEGVFRQPEAVAVGPSGRVFVADQFSHLVQVFSASGTYEGQWGSAGAGPGQFGAVGGLAVDRHGDVYLVDATNDRVEKFTADGGFIASWGGRGKGAGQFDFGGGQGTYEPPGGGIAVSNSFVYVSDTANNRVQRLTLDGKDAQVLVPPGSRPGEVLSPHGLALGSAQTVGPRGREATGRGPRAGAGEALYVADDGNDRVQELAVTGKFIAQAGLFLAAPGKFENAPGVGTHRGFVYNPKSHKFVRISVPFDVAVLGDFVYVADDNYGAIVKFTRDLRFVGTFSGHGTDRLSHFLRALAAAPTGRIYVADSSAEHIVVFDPAGSPLGKWGSSGIAPGQFLVPTDVVAARDGGLLVAEPNREIVPLYPGDAPLSYRAVVAYHSPWSSGGGVTLGSHLFSPVDLAVARDGSVWVADSNNDLLRHLSSSGRFLSAVGGHANRRLGSASLDEPHGLAIDSAGEVIVANTGANRIDKLAPDGRTLAVWSAPGRAAGVSSAGAAPGASGFRRPLGVAVGAKDAIYVADSGNARLVELDRGGRLVRRWGGRGSAPGRFVDPDGIAIDADGHVFVADGVLDRIQEFTAQGKLLAVWGKQGAGAGELSEPAAMTLDCRGDLLVADTGNNRVQVFRRAGVPAGCTASPAPSG